MSDSTPDRYPSIVEVCVPSLFLWSYNLLRVFCPPQATAQTSSQSSTAPSSATRTPLGALPPAAGGGGGGGSSGGHTFVMRQARKHPRGQHSWAAAIKRVAFVGSRHLSKFLSESETTSWAADISRSICRSLKQRRSACVFNLKSKSRVWLKIEVEADCRK